MWNVLYTASKLVNYDITIVVILTHIVRVHVCVVTLLGFVNVTISCRKRTASIIQSSAAVHHKHL